MVPAEPIVSIARMVEAETDDLMNKRQVTMRLLLVTIVVAIGGCVLPMSGHYYKLTSSVGTAINNGCTRFGGPQSVLLLKRMQGRLYLHAVRSQNSTIVLLGYINEYSNSPIDNLADIRLDTVAVNTNQDNTRRTVTIEKFLWKPIGFSACRCKQLPYSGGIAALSNFVRVPSFAEAYQSHNRSIGPSVTYQLVQMRISPTVDKFSVLVPSMTIGQTDYPEFTVTFSWSEGTWLPPPFC